ncbi:MAG: hypothetical protein RIQ93_3549 [Verrucomicrobiota bacterium]|jgi:hypothetical protein
MRMTTFTGVALISLAAVTPWAAPRLAAAAPRLDRRNLLEYRNHDGVVLPVRSVRDWKLRREEILRGAQAVMGPLPGTEKRVSLDVRIEAEKDFGDYVRRFITYAAEPGSRVPAFLFIPKDALGGATRRPGVLCLMGSGGYRLEDSTDTTMPANSHDGENLARRGLVAIAPAYPILGFGRLSGVAQDYKPDLRQLGYQSGTMKAVWDNMRALDLLASLPFVKESGFGAIGGSLGGHNSIYTAVFDERIKVIVSNCGFDSFLDYVPANWQRGKGWSQELYMPKIMDYPRAEIPFDFHELVGALAPRAFFANSPSRDANFNWRSVDRVIAAAAQIYQLHGVPGLLTVTHPDLPHSYMPPEIQQVVYDWIERFL